MKLLLLCMLVGLSLTGCSGGFHADLDSPVHVRVYR